MKINKVFLPKLVGKGYGKFWRFKGRYRVCKGSRGSKKSKTTALWFIFNIIKYPKANLLVVRKTERTLKDSCYTDLKWAMNKLGVAHLFKCTLSPLEITYIPTGQKILFRGLDDPLKITSITVEHGSLCWVWIEEAYELMDEKSFDMLDESIRGEVDDGLFKQITITFNPWDCHHWLKARFFDVEDDDILAMTTNYMCNEWLDEADKKVFERMKVQNPKRYLVAGLGEWGVSEGLIFENWRIEKIDDSVKKEVGAHEIFGLDYGYTQDPTALFVGIINLEKRKLYVCDEMYEKKLSNERIAENIKAKGYQHKMIVADSAEPKSNNRLRVLGITNLRGSKKGKDSIRSGIDFLQDFEIIIDPRCTNFIKEISNYAWDEDKFGNKINKPIDDFNHLMDAMRYACEPYMHIGLFSFD